jgi:hypothetical protein
MVAIGRLCFMTELDDMNEWDALESNKTVVGFKHARHIPSTTFWACCASLLVIWLTLPYMKFYYPCGFTWFPAPGAIGLDGHCHAKWPVNPHVKQAPPLWLAWAGALCEVGALGRVPCCMFWWGDCYTLGQGAYCWGLCIWKLGCCAWKFGRCTWNWGRDTCISICNRFICSGLKNWLGCEKWGLTLLLEGCKWNDTFLLTSFPLSLILFSITMALSAMWWKYA